jgi:peptide deformylase
MSEILKINTEESVAHLKEQEEVIEPFPLYGEDFPMLEDEIPLYNESLPNRSMSNLIKRLKLTMKLYGGVGLSANQCGVFERVFVIGTDQFQIACINPKVLEVSNEIQKDKEGCLSFPGLFLKTERPKSVHVEFVDELGEIKRMWLDGLTARCFLHELDHMNGIKFTSYVKPVALKLARQKQEKTVKKVQRAYKKSQKENGLHV